jgi:hypothetical protein
MGTPSQSRRCLHEGNDNMASSLPGPVNQTYRVFPDTEEWKAPPSLNLASKEEVTPASVAVVSVQSRFKGFHPGQKRGRMSQASNTTTKSSLSVMKKGSVGPHHSSHPSRKSEGHTTTWRTSSGGRDRPDLRPVVWAAWTLANPIFRRMRTRSRAPHRAEYPVN